MADNVTPEQLKLIEDTYQVSLRQLRTMLTATTRLRERAEKTATETREELERLAEALCPGLIDHLRKEHPDGTLPLAAKELADRVKRDVMRRLGRLGVAEAAGQSLGELYDQATAEILRQQECIMRLQQELTEVREQGKQSDLRMQALQQALESAQRRAREARERERQREQSWENPIAAAPPPVADVPAAAATDSGGDTHADADGGGDEGRAVSGVDAALLPEWIQQWVQRRGSDRDLLLLRILAETAVPRRVDLEREFEQAGHGASQRPFERCEEAGLVETAEPKGETVGRAAHLVRLTERGRDICRLLLGFEPEGSQMTELIKRHKTEEHALLNLEAADLLRAAGYVVDLFPDPIMLPGETPSSKAREFAPDLVATYQGRTLFVEVERKTFKNEPDRERKWRNYYDATGGHFCVVVPDKKTLDALRGEIQFWGRGLKLTLWMISITGSKKLQGHDVWATKVPKKGR